jgi:hypothetical protein
MHVRPGGILLAPELEIVVDAKGLTGALSQGAVTSLAGDQVGGQFTREGKTYTAVKAPGSSKRVQVPAGKFAFQQRDLLVAERHLALDRFYDSTTSVASPIGPGWSLVPFTLETDGATSTAPNGTRLFHRPVLRDWETGLELKYRFENKGDRVYRPLGPDQPRLVVEDNGQYVAIFAHGLVARFDADGRLQVVGFHGTEPQATYHYQEGRLVSITGPAGRIDFHYEPGGSLRRVVADDGGEIRYEVDGAGRLASTIADDASYQFAYTERGLLRKVTKVVSRGRAEMVVENTYDTYGRMLTHQTSKGRQEFGYDDRLGRATIREPRGKMTFYYDGHGRLVAYGEDKAHMTLLNYDVDGRILQVALGKLVNHPTAGDEPRFMVSKIVSPPPAKGKD